MIKRREFIAGLGSAAALPLAARAQQPAIPVIGILSLGTESPGGPFNNTAAFHQGLGELGYIEGRNVEILYRWAEFRNDRFPALAEDLVRRRVAVIVATSETTAARAAKSATATIPIVFTTGADPVEEGLVASLNRPGGNVTGVSFLTTALIAKRLELLHELVPAAKSIGFLVNPTTPQVEVELRETETAAGILGVHLVILNASTPSQIEMTFANLVGQRIDALMVGGGGLFGRAYGVQLAALAARHAMPAIYTTRVVVDAGGLMSYGASVSDAFRLAGTYVGRILKGEKPAELPVQRSARFEMVLNLKTAKALGLIVPQTLLATADQVIE
jgi:putative tryptophan/tyrosine transport system substrate-binding protein